MCVWTGGRGGVVRSAGASACPPTRRIGRTRQAEAHAQIFDGRARHAPPVSSQRAPRSAPDECRESTKLRGREPRGGARSVAGGGGLPRAPGGAGRAGPQEPAHRIESDSQISHNSYLVQRTRCNKQVTLTPQDSIRMHRKTSVLVFEPWFESTRAHNGQCPTSPHPTRGYLHHIEALRLLPPASSKHVWGRTEHAEREHAL